MVVTARDPDRLRRLVTDALQRGFEVRLLDDTFDAETQNSTRRYLLAWRRSTARDAGAELQELVRGADLRRYKLQMPPSSQHD